RLAEVVAAFAHAPLPVLFPVHPRTRPLLSSAGVGDDTPNIHLTDPVGYLDMLSLQRDAAAIVTDSGGIQEESCMLGTPCVTVRRNTERALTVEVGANRLVSAFRAEIDAGVVEALSGSTAWACPDRWDDQVAARVLKALESGIEPLKGC
nr:UDP-N-acetylglucosamine 2-epimerase [Actinomycetota bacterium]